MENHQSSPIKSRRPPKMGQRQASPVKFGRKLIAPPHLLITLRPSFSQAEAQLAPLLATLKEDEEIYVACALTPQTQVAVRSQEQAMRCAEKWVEDGMYVSTGTFATKTARTRA